MAGVAVLAFAAGSWRSDRAIRAQLTGHERAIERLEQALGASGNARSGTALVGVSVQNGAAPDEQGTRAVVERVKAELQEEMGLMPLSLVRERRDSFAELYAKDKGDSRTYGTAGYLGDGYFITVKHAVSGAMASGDAPIHLKVSDRYLRAHVVDAGDAAGEVDPGDWAVLKVGEPVALTPLRVDMGYEYPFGDPLVRLGNDYSKGIMVTTGLVGQKRNGLVTCLTDGHPGVSGGGVLNRRGDLVGIQVGRLDGDYRFSFILPLRSEMFRKLSGLPLATADRTPSAAPERPVPPPSVLATTAVATAGR